MRAASEVAAFFDLDGTLLPEPSIERRFLRFALWRGEIGPMHLLRWAAQFLGTIAIDPHAATHGNKAYLSGMNTSVALDFEARLASRPLQFFSAGLRMLEWHAAREHRIFLITGAPAPMAEIAARKLPVPVEIVATELEELDGRWTGRIRGEHVSSQGKRRAMEKIAARMGIDLARSFAYGNSYADVRMLESVAFPAVVNPTELLERLAHLRGWPVLEWHAREAEPASAAKRSRAIARSPLRRAAFLSVVHPTFGANR